MKYGLYRKNQKKRYGLVVATYYICIDSNKVEEADIEEYLEDCVHKFEKYAVDRDIVLVDGYVDIDNYLNRDVLLSQIEDEYGGPYQFIITIENIEKLSDYNDYICDHDTIMVNISE